MRRSKAEKIDNILKSALKDLNIDRRLKEFRITNEWEEVVGKTIASYTQKIYIQNRILYLHMNSSVAKNELMLLRESLVKKINERAGENLIDKIVFR